MGRLSFCKSLSWLLYAISSIMIASFGFCFWACFLGGASVFITGVSCAASCSFSSFVAFALILSQSIGSLESFASSSLALGLGTGACVAALAACSALYSL